MSTEISGQGQPQEEPQRPPAEQDEYKEVITKGGVLKVIHVHPQSPSARGRIIPDYNPRVHRGS